MKRKHITWHAEHAKRLVVVLAIGSLLAGCAGQLVGDVQWDVRRQSESSSFNPEPQLTLK